MLRLAKKPSGSELWQTIKICALGIVAIGALGYIIKLLASFITGSVPW